MSYRRGWITLLLFALALINYIDRVTLSFAATPIAQEYGLSPVLLGYLFSSFLWSYTLFVLPMGLLVDRFGAKWVAGLGLGVHPRLASHKWAAAPPSSATRAASASRCSRSARAAAGRMSSGSPAWTTHPSWPSTSSSASSMPSMATCRDISAFGIDPATGKLSLLNRQSTEGRNPAHLLIDASRRYVVVANYATGTVAVLPRMPDGSLGAVCQVVANPGTPEPNKVDQTASHPHQVAYSPDGRFLIVPDKGLDRVFSYTFDAGRGELAPGAAPFVQVRPGAGPRHIAFHPAAPFAYVAHELDASAGAYRYDAARGALTPFQIIPSIPDQLHRRQHCRRDRNQRRRALRVRLQPRSRQRWQIRRRSANRPFEPGRLGVQPGPGAALLRHRSVWRTGGGERLYAANENSDSIVAFQVDGETGALTPTGQVIATGSPVCIVFSTGDNQ